MEIIDDVKNYLDITWEMSVGESKKLSDTIERGKRYLEGKIGECDFEGETPEKELLLNYCMYDRAGQLNDFKENYRGDIIALQMNRWRKKKGGANAEAKG